MLDHSPLRFALALGAVGFAMGCGSDASPELTAFCTPVLERIAAYADAQATAHPLPDDPRFGGTVVVAGGADLNGGLNAFSTQDQTTQETELYLFHVTLLRFDENRNPRPYLAESWTLDDDGRGATVRIRDDMRWHDGEPVTADDVAFSFRTAMDPGVSFLNSGWFGPYDPEGVEVIDERTVRFAFTPHSEVLDPWGGLPIMPAHLLGDVAPDSLAAHPFGTQCPVGAGPFLFDAYRPGDQWVLRANPGFPQDLGGRPFADRYVYRVITSSTTRAAELAAGGVDVALGLEPSDAETVEARPGLRLVTVDQRSFSFIGWNTRLPGLSDPRVRNALTSALDRDAIVRTLLGEFGTVAETGVPQFHWAYDPSLEGPDFDPAAARAALEAAGWVDRDGDGVRENDEGDELRFDLVTNPNSEREGIGRIVRDQLAEVGVAVQFGVQEMGTLQEKVLNPGSRDFGGFIMGWSHDFNINERDFFHSTAAEGHPYGWAGISDPTLDRLLDTLPSIIERETARPFWRDYQERIVELQPFTYLFFPQRLNGIDDDLRGVEMDLRGELLSAAGWYWDPGSR